MGKNIIQAQVVNPATAEPFDPKKRAWKLSLFHPDGTPLAPGDGTPGVDGVDGVDGAPGAPGASAYEIWLAAGHSGTVNDYLASLVGPPGTSVDPAVVTDLDARISALESVPASSVDLTNLDPNSRIQWRDQATGHILAEMYLEHPPEGQYLYSMAYKSNGVEDQGLLLASADNFVDALARVADGDTNGLFYWIGTNRGIETWVNPALNDWSTVVSVSGSNPYDADGLGQWSVPRAVTARDGQGMRKEWASPQTPGQWIKWDLGANRRMEVTEYTLQRLGAFSPSQQIRNWKLQGSLNNVDWTDLDTRALGPETDAANVWSRYTLPAPDPGAGIGWRYLRILSTGVNTGGFDQVVLAEAEFYGILRATAGAAPAPWAGVISYGSGGAIEYVADNGLLAANDGWGPAATKAEWQANMAANGVKYLKRTDGAPIVAIVGNNVANPGSVWANSTKDDFLAWTRARRIPDVNVLP